MPRRRNKTTVTEAIKSLTTCESDYHERKIRMDEMRLELYEAALKEKTDVSSALIELLKKTSNSDSQ